MQPRLNLLPQSFAISLQLGRVFTAESQSPQSCYCQIHLAALSGSAVKFRFYLQRSSGLC